VDPRLVALAVPLFFALIAVERLVVRRREDRVYRLWDSICNLSCGVGQQALAIVLEACRTGRLTRNQHVLFRLGELVAWTEGAEIFARKAASSAAGQAHPKTLSRFDATALAAMSRVFAREAAQKVALEGSRWVAGAADAGSPAVAAVQGVPTAAVLAAQAGLVGDLDQVADILYDRNH